MSELESTEQQPEQKTEPESLLQWRETSKAWAGVSKGFYGKDGGAIFERGWPKHQVNGGCHQGAEHGACKSLVKLVIAPLKTLLEARFRCPAYFVTYQPIPEMPYRLTHEIFDKAGALSKVGGSIRMSLFAMDVDRHDLKPDELDTWFESERPKLLRLRERHGCLIYRSRGGYRILGVLPRPHLIKNAKQILDWKRRYLSWVCYLGREFEIGTDGKLDELTDWQRFQRVPHDLRSEDGKPEEREIIGDTDRIGVWDPPLTDEDREWAKSKAREKRITSKAPKYRQSDQAPYAGETVLRRLLVGAGLLGEKLEEGKWDTVCPAESQHSTESPHDTVIYENGGRWGHSAACTRATKTGPERSGSGISTRRSSRTRRRMPASSIGTEGAVPTTRRSVSRT